MKTAGALLLLLFLAACGNGEPADIQQFVNQPVAGGHVPPLPAPVVPPPFTYQAQNLPDPFAPRPELMPKPAAGTPVHAARPYPGHHAPLEAWPLSQLKLVGTIHAGHRAAALVQEPDGTVVAARAGDWVGQDGQRIRQITDDAVFLAAPGRRAVPFRWTPGS